MFEKVDFTHDETSLSHVINHVKEKAHVRRLDFRLILVVGAGSSTVHHPSYMPGSRA